MADKSFTIHPTQEVHLERVALRKVAEIGEKVKAEHWTGWESGSPEKGKPYLIHLENRGSFRTSPIREIEKTRAGVVIRTDNSIYEIRYLRKGAAHRDSGE